MKTFITTLLSLSIFFQTKSQTNDPFQVIADREADKFMRDKGAVGLAIGIYKNGSTHTYVYGRIDKEKTDKPTAGSIFNIASLSKTFTGLLLAQAVSEKRASMDDDVRKYLGDGYPNLEYNGQPVRLNHLISHLSRIPSSLSKRAEDPGYAREDFFEDLHTIKLDTIPGIRFMYSNAAVQLLGYILEDIYKMPFAKLIHEKITGPLKMGHTSVGLSNPDKRLMTKGYNEDGTYNPDPYDYLQGAGGMKSTVDDMLKYLAFQMNENNDAMRLSHQEIWGFDMDASQHYSFSMGWQIVKKQDGLRRISQDGNLRSYSSVMIFCPELGTGIIVLSNSFMMKPAGALATAILKEIEPGMP